MTVRATAPHRQKRGKALFIGGLLGLVFGTGPLVVVCVAAALGWTDDPNPNPIGLGLLAMLTLWPSLLCTLSGATWWSFGKQHKQ